MWAACLRGNVDLSQSRPRSSVRHDWQGLQSIIAVTAKREIGDKVSEKHVQHQRS